MVLALICSCLAWNLEVWYFGDLLLVFLGFVILGLEWVFGLL